VEEANTNITVLDIDEAKSVQPSQLNGVTVIVSTMQAFRVEETEGRKVYEQNGSLMGHFPASLKPELLAPLDKLEDGSPVYSLANVLALHRPLVIVDEAHNARTDLSFSTLKRFAPSCILEFTATPDTEDYPSNVLHTVSAAELKAEGMIKLPIYLETQQDWKIAISQAIAKRNELDSIARLERAETGEYLRPIVLLQAQPTYKNKSSVNVEAVKEQLLQEQIPEDQIAIATGDNNEITNIDLFAPECPIRYIITVQALREGWDCSFAYILCTVAEQVGATAVEQILGRVLRQPNAQAKQHSELNRAYTFATSLHFAQTANSLADALIHNGFEKQEVRNLIQVAQQQALEDSGYWFGQNETDATAEMPGTYKAGMASAQSTPFSVPKLAVNMGDFLEQFDDSFFEERSLDLARQDPYLSQEEFPKDAPTGISVELDIDRQGKISSNFITDLHQQTYLLASDQKVTKETLAKWLDGNIVHKDVPQQESHAFFLGMVERLLEKHRWTLGELWREKYRLKEAARKKVDDIRKAVKSDVFAKTLFSTSEYELVATPDLSFTFDPEPDGYPYPPNSLFEGRHKFKKHYYKVIGDMKAEGEEFQCAQLLDNHPKVKRWVRNLEGRPGHSFWLQTSTDRFYPDFVCELVNGRFLVVEYKGFDRWSDDDSKEKRAIGQVWEEKSDGHCLFVMPKGPDWNAILAKLGE
jgi:type III restriction enzyme